MVKKLIQPSPARLHTVQHVKINYISIYNQNINKYFLKHFQNNIWIEHWTHKISRNKHPQKMQSLQGKNLQILLRWIKEDLNDWGDITYLWI